MNPYESPAYDHEMIEQQAAQCRERWRERQIVAASVAALLVIVPIVALMWPIVALCLVRDAYYYTALPLDAKDWIAIGTCSLSWLVGIGTVVIWFC